MVRTEIAGLTVEMSPCFGRLEKNAVKYLTDGDAPADIRISLSEEFLKEKQAQYQNLSLSDCCYCWAADTFYYQLLDFGGFMLHSSCVRRGDKAYLFSADSGTGKSTHTHLWLKAFADAEIINDDKPAMREFGGVWHACGTPFSGKSNENVNLKIPVRAVVFLERGQENQIEPLSVKEAIPLLMKQTLRPQSPERSIRLLELLDRFFKAVPMFRLRCNMDPAAALTAYGGIESYIKETEEAE